MLKACKVGHIDVEISEEDKVVWLTTGNDPYEISVIGVYADEAKELIRFCQNILKHMSLVFIKTKETRCGIR